MTLLSREEFEKLPQYVKIGDPVTGTAMRLSKTGSTKHGFDYYRVGGNWNIKFKYKDGQMITTPYDTSMTWLKDLAIYPVTFQEYYDDQSEYAEQTEDPLSYEEYYEWYNPKPTLSF